MDEIRKNESDMAVSFSILIGHTIALSELSIFPKECTVDFINDATINQEQKSVVLAALEKSENIYFYNRLKVPTNYEGKGYGTKLLNATLEFIKEKNAFLINTANAYGEKNQEELIAFYQKSGMVLIHKDGGLVYAPSLDLEKLNELADKKINKKKI
jgi:GNAT superfamily N-acetyltransferase